MARAATSRIVQLRACGSLESSALARAVPCVVNAAWSGEGAFQITRYAYPRSRST